MARKKGKGGDKTMTFVIFFGIKPSAVQVRAVISGGLLSQADRDMVDILAFF
jgi:hypothetical protein